MGRGGGGELWHTLGDETLIAIRCEYSSVAFNPNKAGLFQKEPRNLKSFTAQKGLK